MKFMIATAMTALALGAADAQAAGGGDRGARIDKLFEAIDLNGDDRIDAAEIEASRKARFAAGDANADGALSEEEVLAVARERIDNRAERMANRMMKRLDSNGDGSISSAEFEAGADDRGGRMMKRLDADGDGVITRAEVAEKADRRKRQRDDQ
ncbi:MAG: EF-hand domain-containing protein [Pseudomonadota bacterium]